MNDTHRMNTPSVMRVDAARICKSYFNDVVVVRTTNKETILWCPSKLSARRVAMQLDEYGYSVEMKAGKSSSSYYVKAKLTENQHEPF